MRAHELRVDDKTLYVCVNNVGRSQMARAMHNDLEPGGADSAGLNVDAPGGRVADWAGGAQTICEAMEEIGLPIGEMTRTAYDDTAARKYARVIFIVDTEQVPDDLAVHDPPRRVFWPVPDPRDKAIEKVRNIRDHIWSSVGLVALRANSNLSGPIRKPQPRASLNQE